MEAFMFLKNISISIASLLWRQFTFVVKHLFMKKKGWQRRIKVKVKVKVTLVQALRLCTGRTAHRGSRGIAVPFHDHGTIRGWGVSVSPRPLFAPGKEPVPIVQEAGWAPGPVWTGAENLTPHRDSIPGPSSLYQVAIPTELPGRE
jgi:hypothetical protein